MQKFAEFTQPLADGAYPIIGCTPEDNITWLGGVVFLMAILLPFLTVIIEERIFHISKISKLRRLLLYLSTAITIVLTAIPTGIVDRLYSNLSITHTVWDLYIIPLTVDLILMFFVAWKIAKLPVRISIGFSLIYAIVILVIILIGNTISGQDAAACIANGVDVSNDHIVKP